uniref:Thioredoxin reductase-like n=1 Tax=Dermatophagoides pteronyssinus TaxID=6956 RepID=A0A6P6Y532_DERPT|nr:thioredoxin reductase-like [Dermatophagoides pteronyssinus]
MLRGEKELRFDYDFAVIGGGSGGLAAAKRAASFGASTVCFDFVDPSPQGTKWGLGGTCVNVGCIPKKLFHFSARIALLNHKAARSSGWRLPEELEFEWPVLQKNVGTYIKRLNFLYRSGLAKSNVRYINAKASFVDAHTLEYAQDGKRNELTARFILIAVGGRPYIPPNVKGALQHAISSDDLFWLKQSPGKTLVVGASYIALECAGFLLEFGFDVTVCVRSIVLRGFDRQCSEKVQSIMQQLGCKFIHQNLPTEISKLPDGRLQVTFVDQTSATYDTVLYATGRVGQLESLGVKNAQIKVADAERGKIWVDNRDCTSAPSVFAIGDIAYQRPELTPTAIRAGELLADRLFGGKKELMNYETVPTVVFTPFEYGCCGLTEESAIAKYGKEEVEVYLSDCAPTANDADDDDFGTTNLSKLVVAKSSGKVLGFHCVGLNAGETLQGYALAVKMGATKEQFDATVCIHPTDAESFHTLHCTKSSGASWVASSGCGGGKCG